MNDLHEDYKKIMSAILRQAIDDYIRMQHPRYRRRKYEKEAFWSACNLLWDDNHILQIEDDEGRPMTLRALAIAAADRENVDLKRLRQYLLDESVIYWNEKKMKTVTIPEDIVVEGHAYQIHHIENKKYENIQIDYDNKIIFLNKKSPTAEEDFMLAMMELTCHHGEIKTSAKARHKLGKAFYRLLKINNCFTGEN